VPCSRRHFSRKWPITGRLFREADGSWWASGAGVARPGLSQDPRQYADGRFQILACRPLDAPPSLPPTNRKNGPLVVHVDDAVTRDCRTALTGPVSEFVRRKSSGRIFCDDVHPIQDFVTSSVRGFFCRRFSMKWRSPRDCHCLRVLGEQPRIRRASSGSYPGSFHGPRISSDER